MKKQRKKKSLNKFTTKMQKKLVILFIIVLLAFVCLSIRLIMINKDDGEQYKKQVLSQQQYDSITLPYKRGDILDSKGTALAVSEKVYNVILDTKMLLDKEDYLEPTIAALKSCFNIDEATIRAYIKDNPTSQYYILAKKLTYDQISGFQALEADIKTNPYINGVWFEDEYVRSYPYGSLACDLIGFTGTDNTGSYGLEEYYNSTLNGSNGREYGYLNGDSTLERTTKAAVDGNTLITSIDVNIQSIVEKYILQFNEEHKDEAREGAGSVNTGCIIMDVKTGNILAMASYPVYDLNNPKDLSGIYTQEELDAMDQTTLSASWDALWRNYCISDTYEPGSTYKPFTIAAGLESGKLTGNETYTCTGSAWYSGHEIHCNNRAGHGDLTFAGALENSCNVALMQMGTTIGKDTLMQFHRVFNFGLKTNIDLAGETKTDTLQFDVNSMVDSDVAISSFGQGFNVTMIQMISGFCSLINGGYYYEPHVVKQIVNSDGTVVENIAPRVLKQTVSGTTSDKIIELCNLVVSAGTGKTARPAGYAIGGKTGTAETLPRGTGNYVVSFMGYAPADDPQIAIYVVIDRPNVEAQASAKYATGIVRNILTEVLPYLNVFMTEDLSDDEKTELANMQFYIPNTTTTTAEDGTVTVTKDDGTTTVTSPDGTITVTSVDGTITTTAVDGTVTVTPPPDTTSTDTGTTTTGSTTSGSTTTGASTQGNVVDGKVSTGPIAGYEVDPETGYAIDPNTGAFLDPVTGTAIDTTSSFIN